MVLWSSWYLVAQAWIHFFHKWLSKLLFIKISSTNWYQTNFSFTTCPLRAWIEIIILATNNLFGFILTNGFGDEYIFLNFHCKDPFIALLNVSWRPKWFSNLIIWLDKWFLNSGFSSDTGSWRRVSCCSSLIIDPLEVSSDFKCSIICWSSFEILQLVLGMKDLQISTGNFSSRELSYIFKLEASLINMSVSEFFVWGMDLILIDLNLFIKLHTSC